MSMHGNVSSYRAFGKTAERRNLIDMVATFPNQTLLGNISLFLSLLLSLGERFLTVRAV